MKRLFVLLIVLLLPSFVSAQVVARVPARSNVLPESTVANLPPSPPINTVYRVNNGDTSSDCVTGAGTFSVQCYWTGAVWASLGDGSDGSHADLSDLVAPADDHTQYILGDTNAGAPSAGSCQRDVNFIIDTTNENPYFCSDGAGGNPRAFSSLGDAYNTMSDGTTTASASGSEQFDILGGTGITSTVVAGTPDKVTIDITKTSIFGTRAVGLTPVDFTTDTSTGDGKFYFRVPSVLNGMNLVTVTANVITAGTTGTINVDIANCTAAATGNVCSGTVNDVLSTNITIDSAENSTSTAATAVVIDTGQDDVVTGDVIRIDIDTIHTTAAKGLIVNLEFQLP